MADLENPVPNESTPLIGGNGSTDDRGLLLDDPLPLGDIQEHTMMERIVGAGAVVGLSSSLASIALESNPIVYISGAFGAVVSPMAAIQQNKLTQVAALKETNARLKSEVDQLKAENVKLSSHVSSLEASVSHLQDLSQTLEMVRATEGQSLEELERQVGELEGILDTMDTNLTGSIIQTLITVIYGIDHDGDSCLSDEEIDSLILKMEELSTENFDFNNQLLRQKLIENGRSLNAVLDVIKNLMDSDAKKEDSIFAFVNAPVPPPPTIQPTAAQATPPEASQGTPLSESVPTTSKGEEPDESVEVELS